MARGQHGQRGLDSFACAHTIERFVILLYDKTRTSTDADKARCKLFANKSNVQLIPPTSAALKQHVRRAVYQGGHVWGILHQHCAIQLTWGGSKPATRCTSPSGQRSLRHPKSASRSLCPASARRVAQRSASARMQNHN